MGKLLTSATDPTQYDREETGWLIEGQGLESPSRAYFWHYLHPFFRDLQDKTLLDIGSGTGWLLDLALQKGAKKALGIEPSVKNKNHAKQLYPQVETVHTSFESFTTDEKFDIITAIMSFTHILDIDTAFKKLESLLAEDGKIFILTYDFDYASQPRFDYRIEVEHLNEDEYVAAVERKDTSISDVVRTAKRLDAAARKSGLHIIEDIPLFPTPEFIQARPRYVDFHTISTHRLLIFSR